MSNYKTMLKEIEQLEQLEQLEQQLKGGAGSGNFGHGGRPGKTGGSAPGKGGGGKSSYSSTQNVAADVVNRFGSRVSIRGKRAKVVEAHGGGHFASIPGAAAVKVREYLGNKGFKTVSHSKSRVTMQDGKYEVMVDNDIQDDRVSMYVDEL